MLVRALSLHVGLLAGYLVLAIVHTYPLVWRVATHLPGQGLGDNTSFVWNWWWMREALASSSAEFFARAPIEAPLFPSLVLHTHNALAAFLGATLLSPLPVVTAQNILLLFSLALNGFAAYTLARTAGGNRVPSMLAGALFVVAPCVTASSSRPTNALIAGWLLAVAAVFWRWRPRLHIIRRPVPEPVVRSLLVALVIFAVLLVPLGKPAMSYLGSDDYVTQASSLKSSPRGVDLATLVLGPPFNALIGPVVRRAYEWIGLDAMEVSAWLGIGLMILLVIGVRGADLTREVRRWVGITAVFALWALGPFLSVMATDTGILLPQALAHVVPIVNNARMPGRAMVMVVLAALVVLALALSHRRRAVPIWALSLCGGVAIIESLAVPLPLAPVPQPGVYATIADDRGPGAVLTVPFGVRDGFREMGLLEHDSLLGQTVHGHPLVGGFLARLPRRVWSWYEQTEPYRTLLALSAPGGVAEALPSCGEVIAGLRSARVDFVVLYPADAPAALTDSSRDCRFGVSRKTKSACS